MIRRLQGQRAHGVLSRPVRATVLVVAISLVAIVTACDDTGLGPDFDPEVEMFISIMNDHRSSVGCSALDWNELVAEVALDHSKDMAQRDFFAHENPDGSDPFDRLSAAGLEWSRAAENIAFGYPTAEAVLAGWLDSPGHRANIENCSLTTHGIGLYETRWTHMFLTP
jgi:uncharacterized protein YkwD